MDKYTFIERRKKLKENLVKDSLVILASGHIMDWSGDQEFDFEVNKNFYYFTGINQDDVMLVLDLKNDKETIFLKENDIDKIKWIGAKLYPDEAKDISGVDNIEFLPEFYENVTSKYLEYKNIYLDLEVKNLTLYSPEGAYIKGMMHESGYNGNILDIYPLCISLRKRKDKEEVEKIKASIAITKNALEEVLKNLHPGMYEYQIESVFDKEIKWNGQRDHAFKTICASGPNATILHYTKNSSIIKDGDLVLFDLGCRSDFYVSDISRTYPANGKFSPRQKEIYEVVLDTNKKCIAFLHDGVSFKEYNDYCNSLLIAGLKKLGKIKEDSELKKYYWHSVGHPTGLDTHDPCPRSESIVEGMIMTVEPGLYLEDEGIGIRIEDNVLITKDRAINLSSDIIKEIDDIEKFMAKKN